METGQSIQIHATALRIGDSGVLIRGPSGSGKSDLAMRLIDGGALLVADDRCHIQLVENTLVASCPPEISGLIEVRGLGILRLEPATSTPLTFVVDLCQAGSVERMPENDTESILGRALPVVRLDGLEASAPEKVRLALRVFSGHIERISHP